MVKKFKAIYSFELSHGPGGKSGVWFVDVKKDGVVLRGKSTGRKTLSYLVPMGYSLIRENSLFIKRFLCCGTVNTSGEKHISHVCSPVAKDCYVACKVVAKEKIVKKFF